ncbi:hypothetical protein COLO4_08924 [Corchorus olitorius]|uniref:Uncharacterized protein n=1 Tax=Corchorus olitorius TaxID=93759 RepID=A0A1R3KDY8_9ROSI|nr:hypothetical protein COLO4_08924 [Corchorus olitorius]
MGKSTRERRTWEGEEEIVAGREGVGGDFERARGCESMSLKEIILSNLIRGRVSWP